jgi:hypothetical protein
MCDAPEAKINLSADAAGSSSSSPSALSIHVATPQGLPRRCMSVLGTATLAASSMLTIAAGSDGSLPERVSRDPPARAVRLLSHAATHATRVRLCCVSYPPTALILATGAHVKLHA